MRSSIAIATLFGPALLITRLFGAAGASSSSAPPRSLQAFASDTITTIAGDGLWYNTVPSGPALNISFTYPNSVVLDSAGNLFFTDPGDGRVRVLTLANGFVSTLAGTGAQGYSGDGGPSSLAQLNQPMGLAIDAAGNVFFADFGNNVVRKVAHRTQVITTVAGNGDNILDAYGQKLPSYNGDTGDGGAATSATLGGPVSLVLNGNGDLFIGEWWSSLIRVVRASSQIIETVAGCVGAGCRYVVTSDGFPATSVTLSSPYGLVFDAAENLIVSEYGGCRVRLMASGTGLISIIAGTGTCGFSGDSGPATNAQLSGPTGIAIDAQGRLVIADTNNNVIRMIAANGTTRVITTIAGSTADAGTTGLGGYGGDNGAPTSARLCRPGGVAVTNDGSVLYIADSDNERIRRIGPPPSAWATPSVSPSHTATSSASLSSGASPSSTHFPVVMLLVDGPPVTGFLVAGASAYYAYSQPLPYGVVLTLRSFTGDADLYVGSAHPTPAGVFAFNASSTNGDQQIDAIACVSPGPAWSASGDLGTSCYGPQPTSTWYVRVTGWTACTFSLNASSMLSDPLFVGSPQPSPGAIPSLPQLGLGVTAAGRLSVADTSAYWLLSIPIEAAASPTYIYLHIVSGGGSDADLLVGLSPPYGLGNTEFGSQWESSNTGDDWVTIPAHGAASTSGFVYIAVKAYAAPVSYTVVATSVVAGNSQSAGGGGSGGGGQSAGGASVNVVFIAAPIVAGLVFCCIVAFGVKTSRERKAAELHRAVATGPPMSASSNSSSNGSGGSHVGVRVVVGHNVTTANVSGGYSMAPSVTPVATPYPMAAAASQAQAVSPGVSLRRPGSLFPSDATETPVEPRFVNGVGRPSSRGGGVGAAAAHGGGRATATAPPHRNDRHCLAGTTTPSAAAYALGVEDDDFDQGRPQRHRGPPPSFSFSSSASAASAHTSLSHPPAQGSTPSGAAREQSLDGGNDACTCTICLCECVTPVTVACGHSFCRSCLGDWMTSQRAAGRVPKCPMRCPARLPESPSDLHTNLDLERAIAANKRLREALAAANAIVAQHRHHEQEAR